MNEHPVHEAQPAVTPHGRGHGHGLGHEEVRAVRGARTGLPVVVAVHSTELGPALGGCRLRRYPTWQDALDDALRLSAAMTDKAALADLAFGGGKVVAALPPVPLDADAHRALILDVADLVAAVDGRYVTGPDMGVTPEDMRLVHERTGHALCRPSWAGGAGDSAPATAVGVVAALQAGAQHVFGSTELAGRTVSLIGYGSVGRRIATWLVEHGARLTVADTDVGLRPLVEDLGATWVEPDALLAQRADILVPAATGGVLDAGERDLDVRLVVGPANNQTVDVGVLERLHRRGVTCVPDVVASAGGIIHAVGRERLGLSEDLALGRVRRIGDTVSRILALADRADLPPLAVARSLSAQKRLDPAAAEIPSAAT